MEVRGNKAHLDKVPRHKLTLEVDVDLFHRPRVEKNKIAKDKAQVDKVVGSILAAPSCNTW